LFYLEKAVAKLKQQVGRLKISGQDQLFFEVIKIKNRSVDFIAFLHYL